MTGPGKLWQGYWMSASVFFIGIFSFILLLSDYRISERLRHNSNVNDAIMDVQIHTATGHLWIEQSIRGDTDVVIGAVLADLDAAIKLVDAIIHGGQAEHEFISEPLKDPGLRARAEEIKSLLVKFKLISLERLHDPTAGSDPALYKQHDDLFKEILVKARALEDIMEDDEAGNRDKYDDIFHAVLVIWVIVGVGSTVGLRRLEVKRIHAEESLLEANEQLSSQAEELTTHREHLEELVEMRTAELTNAVETLKGSEKQILSLSSRLINAQEVERRRISMELHDELGQALNATKLRLRFIEKGLGEDQQPLREECEELLDYLDHVIEDVRRLSLDLSPTILEDLGLTSALRWLIGNLTRIPGINIELDLEDIDHLFHRNHWITIYRIVQESLTNIWKHAQAKNVSVVIQRNGDKVEFSIEDDGKGFDPHAIQLKNMSDIRLGLVIMSERVKMIGGNFDLWSQQGKGTRISFIIPIGKEEA